MTEKKLTLRQRLAAAQSEAQLAQLWSDLGITGDPVVPPVDLEKQMKRQDD